MTLRYLAFGASAAAMICAAPAMADSVTYDGIDFPGGDISFADVVVIYEPNLGGTPPTDPNYMDETAALGAPDYDSPNGSVSLGSGGRITLQFTDNVLTGSGDDGFDLHVFEIGPDVEDTFVEISKDGSDFVSVGKVFGSTSSIDIDAFGFGISDLFYFVRLTDDPNEGERSGSTVGADIDAVGAITTMAPPPPTVVPTPSAAVAGLAAFGMLLTRRRAGRV